MPSVSKKQQKAMAIALHHPEKLHERNRGLLEMSREDLRDYASTPHKGLPNRAGGKKASLKSMLRAAKAKR